MLDPDIIIIGGGTAGLYSALGIDSWDGNYIVIEEKNNIGWSERTTGGIAKYWLDKYGIHLPDEVIATTIRSVDIIGKNFTTYRLSYNEDIGYVIKPIEFLRYLGNKIKGQIVLGERVLGYRKMNDNLFKVLTNKNTYISKFIINASGPFGVKVKAVDRHDMIIGYERGIKRKDTEHKIRIFFSDLAPMGYLWDFDGGNGIRREGLGFPVYIPMNPKKNLLAFLHAQNWDGEVIHEFSHPIPVAYPLDEVSMGNVAYVGDAGRFVFASTGGGIQGAILSGYNAGFSLKHGNFDTYDLWYYNFRKYLLRHYKIKKLLYSFTLDEIDNLLYILKDYKPKTLNPIAELSRVVGYLMVRKPKIILNAIKSWV
jgi:flavin-dependent dehydrogenase